MSIRPNGSHAHPAPSDVDMKAILYALHANGFYPASPGIIGHWGAVMQWWHGLEPVTWLENETGWTCTLKDTTIPRRADHGPHPQT